MGIYRAESLWRLFERVARGGLERGAHSYEPLVVR